MSITQLAGMVTKITDLSKIRCVWLDSWHGLAASAYIFITTFYDGRYHFELVVRLN